jgi:uncharacterized membrane protein
MESIVQGTGLRKPEKMETNQYRAIYVILSHFVLPYLVLVVVSVLMVQAIQHSRKLRHQMLAMANSRRVGGQQQQQQELDLEIRISIMLVLIILAFIGCYIPVF